MKKCPKCGYVRREEDAAPSYGCPACGVVYAKARQNAQAIPSRWRESEQAIPEKWRESEQQRSRVGFGTWVRRPMSLLLLILSALLVTWIIDDTWGTGRQLRTERIWREAAEKARSPIVSNSAWDGSVRQVEQYLRARLHDPSSFEAVRWAPVKKQNGKHIVYLRYRAKNAFGAMVLKDATFVLSSGGAILSMSE